MKNVILLTAALMLSTAVPALANRGDHAEYMKDMFKQKDSNGDGFISQQESNDFHARQFKDADANDDGKVSLEEMTAHKKEKKQDYKSSVDKTTNDKDKKPGGS